MSEKNRSQKWSATYIASLGLLAAVIIVFHFSASILHLGATSFAIVLIPIVLGACLLGPTAGGILGGIFGLVALLCGVFGMDAFTNLLFNTSPIGTILVCMLKGVLCGVIPGLIYKPFKGKREKLGTILACMASPIVNTGVFILGMFILMTPFSSALSMSGGNYVHFILIDIAGINFLVEFAINIICSAAVVAIIKALQ